MRRLAFICAVLGLVLPASALAARNSPADGTLAVRSASGDPGIPVIGLNVTGAAVGQIVRGRIMIDDPNPNDGPAPDVTGAERARDISNTATVYSGTNIRFRAVGGRFRIRIFGTGIDANVVGQGTVWFTGSTTLLNSGKYSVNGGDWKPVPDFVKFQLSAGS